MSGGPEHTDQPKQQWHNHLPLWILEDPGYRRLRQAKRHTLQTIANKCDRADTDGNLMGAFGG